jgi:integrase
VIRLALNKELEGKQPKLLPLLGKAGLADKGFTIHSLRHTFATTLADKGVHPSTAQKVLGHSDIRMTLAIYTHATDGMRKGPNAFDGGYRAGGIGAGTVKEEP